MLLSQHSRLGAVGLVPMQASLSRSDRKVRPSSTPPESSQPAKCRTSHALEKAWQRKAYSLAADACVQSSPPHSMEGGTSTWPRQHGACALAAQGTWFRATVQPFLSPLEQGGPS